MTDKRGNCFYKHYKNWFAVKYVAFLQKTILLSCECTKTVSANCVISVLANFYNNCIIQWFSSW